MASIKTAAEAVSRIEKADMWRDRTLSRAGDNPDRILRAHFHHMRRIRNARRQVRFNRGLDNLDQAVLGTTGSPELLNRYRQLAKEIGHQANKPIVQIIDEDPCEGVIRQARIGETSGPLHVWANFLHQSHAGVAGPRQTAFLRLPVSFAMNLVVRHGSPEMSAAGESFFPVASINLDETLGSNPTLDPGLDIYVSDRVESGRLLIGEDAIRSSEYFESSLAPIGDVIGLSE